MLPLKIKGIIIAVLLLTCFSVRSQTDYWAYQVYFSGCPVNHIPKGIFIPDRDKKARAIINAIIDGSSYEQLQQKFPDSLDIKLTKLINGKVIERDQSGFRVLFPVLTGEKRAKLQAIIHDRLAGSKFSIDPIVDSLKKAFKSNPEMIFHFLWSRIIDESWWNSYNATFRTDQGPPSIAFIVYPPHSYQCGTNSDYSTDNDMFAMSWSYNIFDESFQVPSSKAFFSLAAGRPIGQSDQDFFLRHGLAESGNKSLIYTFRVNDSTDRLCDTLKQIYIDKIKDLFNYNELGETFRIPPDELYLVVLHEVAYEIIGALYEKRSISLPITTRDNPSQSLRYLVSIRYNN